MSEVHKITNKLRLRSYGFYQIRILYCKKWNDSEPKIYGNYLERNFTPPPNPGYLVFDWDTKSEGGSWSKKWAKITWFLTISWFPTFVISKNTKKHFFRKMILTPPQNRFKRLEFSMFEISKSQYMWYLRFFVNLIVSYKGGTYKNHVFWSVTKCTY